MKRYIQSTSIIDNDFKRIWKYISKASEVEQWHPLVTKTIIDGNNRICQTEQGRIMEKILVNDHDNMTFKYHIYEQNVYPSEDITSTMKIVEGKKGTLLLWDIEFECDSDKQFQEMKEGMEAMVSSVSRAFSDI